MRMGLRRAACVATCVLVLPLCLLLQTPSSQTFHPRAALVVGSYNLWNVMFGWESRKLWIANAIREAGVHVVGLEEVRQYGVDGLDQLEDLKALLPEFRWAAFAESTSLESGREGVAILSRLPITGTQIIDLSGTYVGADKNGRVALIAILSSPVGRIKVVMTHLSYDRNTQCHNVKLLSQALERSHGEAHQIIMGDLNMYPNDDAPLAILTGGDLNSRCKPMLQGFAPSPNNMLFKDAWSSLHGPEEKGFTFSNMPTPGPVSRPDRILYSTALSPHFSEVRGNGSSYEASYYSTILANRMKRILANGDCGFDCGPRGRCQCGVCVLADGDNCAVPCLHCHGGSNKLAILLVVDAVLVAGVLMSGLRRRVYWLFAVVALGVFNVWALLMLLQRQVQVLMDVMPEELRPSDHRFLIAGFEGEQKR